MCAVYTHFPMNNNDCHRNINCVKFHFVVFANFLRFDFDRSLCVRAEIFTEEMSGLANKQVNEPKKIEREE